MLMFQNESSENKNPNQKPKLDNTCHSSSSKAPSEIYDLNNTANIILGRALSNVELSKCEASNLAVTPTSQHYNILSVNTPLQPSDSEVTDRQASAPTSQALFSSAECDVISASAHTSSAAEPVSHRPLDVGTQDLMNNTPAIVTPLSDISIRSARSYVSVTPSSQMSNTNTSNENRWEQFARRLDTEFDKIRYDYPTPPSNINHEGSDDHDHSGELIIDLDHEPENLNVANERGKCKQRYIVLKVLNNLVALVETTNSAVDVQQTAGVRRKRGRPRKLYTSETDGNDTVNTTARSTTSSKRRSQRQKKCKKQYDCDTELIDDLNYSRRTNEKLT